MPTASGKLNVSLTRNPGPPVTLSMIATVTGSRVGDAPVLLDPVEPEWIAALLALDGKRVTVTYSVGPLVISNVKTE